MYDEKTHDFVLKAKEIHGDDLYDYRQFIYVTCQTKGIIICRIHGPFLKTPLHHLQRKQGCEQCSNLKKSIRSTMTLEQFVAKARKVEVHGDFYNYEQFIYLTSQTKGIIICPIHGPFNMTPARHLSGYGCHTCAMLKAKQNAVEKWGVDHHTKTATYREKVKRTSQERFGFDHRSKAPDFRDSMKKTNIERYGVEFVSQMPEFQAQVRATSLTKFGSEHFLQSPDVIAKRNATNLDRYGRSHIRQVHIPPETLAILADRAKIVDLLAKTSVKELAITLGISDCTLGRYCHALDIYLPSSSYEAGIIHFLQQHTETAIHCHDRLLISPLEIDIVLPQYKIGIEFCGIYWHGEQKIPEKKYHLIKLQQMQQRGYRLITVFEDEWLHQQDIVKNRIMHLLGKSERGKGARQLTIAPVTADKANAFLDAHHIQGAANGHARYAAFDDDRMVAVMAFSHPRVALGRKDGADELIRFATDGRHYPGIASKLLKTFIREHQPDQIISYADRRWSAGRLYEQLGFDLVHETNPNYWYVDRRRVLREHRFKYRKDSIKHLVENGDNKSEYEIMLELGRDRIWDCGSLKYQWAK